MRPALRDGSEPVAASLWSGCYAGLNAGGVATSAPSELQAMSADFILAYGPNVPRGFSNSPAGVIGGGQVGCSVQRDRYVFGAEFDFSGSSAKQTQKFGSLDYTATPVSNDATTNLAWLSTLRGRVGYTATDNLLLYVTGGLAFGRATNSTAFYSPVPLPLPQAGYFYGQSSALQVGFVVGAGAEYAITPHWSIKGEYLYYDLGSRSVTNADAINDYPLDSQTYRFHNTGHIARIGANYHFNLDSAPGPLAARF